MLAPSGKITLAKRFMKCGVAAIGVAAQTNSSELNTLRMRTSLRPVDMLQSTEGPDVAFAAMRGSRSAPVFHFRGHESRIGSEI